MLTEKDYKKMSTTKTELIITSEILRKEEIIKFAEYEIELFESLFPQGGHADVVLKKISELNELGFAKKLVQIIPHKDEDLVLESIDNNLFYPGNVIVKNSIETNRNIYISGSLTVYGSFIYKGFLNLKAKSLTAHMISLTNSAKVDVLEINANNIIKVSDYARLAANSLKSNTLAVFDFHSSVHVKKIKVDELFFVDGHIVGDIITTDLFATNNTGLIKGNLRATTVRGLSRNVKFIPKKTVIF